MNWSHPDPDAVPTASPTTGGTRIANAWVESEYQLAERISWVLVVELIPKFVILPSNFRSVMLETSTATSVNPIAIANGSAPVGILRLNYEWHAERTAFATAAESPDCRDFNARAAALDCPIARPKLYGPFYRRLRCFFQKYSQEIVSGDGGIYLKGVTFLAIEEYALTVLDLFYSNLPSPRVSSLARE
jgi:hypothetical protein